MKRNSQPVQAGSKTEAVTRFLFDLTLLNQRESDTDIKHRSVPLLTLYNRERLDGSGRFNQTALMAASFSGPFFNVLLLDSNVKTTLKRAKLHFTAERSQCGRSLEQSICWDTFRGWMNHAIHSLYWLLWSHDEQQQQAQPQQEHMLALSVWQWSYPQYACCLIKTRTRQVNPAVSARPKTN